MSDPSNPQIGDEFTFTWPPSLMDWAGRVHPKSHDIGVVLYLDETGGLLHWQGSGVRSWWSRESMKKLTPHVYPPTTSRTDLSEESRAASRAKARRAEIGDGPLLEMRGVGE